MLCSSRKKKCKVVSAVEAEYVLPGAVQECIYVAKTAGSRISKFF